jgi:tRNA-uridine 2-sulfurtransferase
MNKRAISLLSGGLDSLLATRLVLDQGVEVIGLHFTSFFSAGKGKVRAGQAEKSASELGIRLIIQDKGPDYLEVVRRPKHGYGRNMNPCIDCRIFMLRKAKEIMEKEAAAFVITGEVLGQRPMSQMRHTIKLIEEESGLGGRILRPLSARLFPPSLGEQEGIVERGLLLDIAGRSRKAQFALAARYGLQEYSCPAGGCLLTDPIYSVKLRELFLNEPDLLEKDIELLRLGRHFRIGQTKLVLGRNKEENEQLEALRAPPYVVIYPIGFTGPLGLVKALPDSPTLDTIANIVSYYGKNRESPVVLEFSHPSGRHVTERREVEADRYRIGERE